MSRLEHVLNVGAAAAEGRARKSEVERSLGKFAHDFVRTWWLYNRHDHTQVTRADTFGVGRRENLIAEFRRIQGRIEEYLRELMSFERPYPNVADLESVTEELVFEFWRMPPWDYRMPLTGAPYPDGLDKIAKRLSAELKKYARGKPSKFDVV